MHRVPVPRSDQRIALLDYLDSPAFRRISAPSFRRRRPHLIRAEIFDPRREVCRDRGRLEQEISEFIGEKKFLAGVWVAEERSGLVMDVIIRLQPREASDARA